MSSHGNVYKSEPVERPVDRHPVPLEVWYFEDRLGPQVLVNCRWGQHLTARGDIGQAIIVPRAEWDAMLRELRP